MPEAWNYGTETDLNRSVRGEAKTPGGKLVAVTLVCDAHGTPIDCTLDGDFFIEGGEERDELKLIQDVEHALLHGYAIQRALDMHPKMRFVGISVRAIQSAYGKALDKQQAQSAHMASSDGTYVEDRGQSTLDSAADSWHNVPDDHAEQWRLRWSALHPIIVHDTPRNPQEQMDIDELWARQVASGERLATLRVWEWAAPCVVIGRFQSVQDEIHIDEARKEGISIVRRCTGGGAMFIEPGNTITYSLYAPRDFASGVSIEQSYQLCDQWLVDSLRELGLDVRFSGLNDISSPQGKIGGAAQRRFSPVNGGPGSILHHVTMSYDIDAEKMGRILNTSAEKLSDKAVASVVKRIDPLRSQTGLSRDGIIRHLLQ